MGQITELSCKCGYKKELHLGTGLMAINERMMRKTFTSEELKDFDAALKDNTLKNFNIENVRVYCPSCNDILSLPTLKYTVGALDKSIRKNCPTCGGKTIETEASGCPKCSGTLEEKAVGHWD